MDIVERLRACCECEQAPLGPLLCDAADELARLRAENEALRADAERYRWLLTTGRIDQAVIDAARKEESK